MNAAPGEFLRLRAENMRNFRRSRTLRACLSREPACRYDTAPIS